ncbi:MAG TPA: hypothetical protein VK154_14975 [Chitinophagales bacterium]|nr:hypothetical protein [Chitinophagales bacterium]
MKKNAKTPEDDSKNVNKNAPAINQKERAEDKLEEKEYETRENISRGYVAKAEEGAEKTKIEERVSDSGSRDDDDDGQYDTNKTNQPADKKSVKKDLYNRDENDEFKKREDDFRQGDDNQNEAQKNSSNPPQKENPS